MLWSEKIAFGGTCLCMIGLDDTWLWLDGQIFFLFYFGEVSENKGDSAQFSVEIWRGTCFLFGGEVYV